MQRLTNTEAEKLLKTLVRLRRKFARTKDKDVLAEYRKCEDLCGQKFDYLVTSKVDKYKAFSNYEDLKQEGRIALLSALRNFDPRKGNFYWWSGQYIKTKIKREANQYSVFHIPIKHIKDMLPYKVLDMPVVIDDCLDATQVIEKNELTEMLSEAIQRLPIEQRKVIELSGIKSYSISSISKELKMARADCVKLLNEAKYNLKQTLKHED
jgi:RNA polymerase sigma factor (sigma-70 family)